jgi:hypothetical protein
VAVGFLSTCRMGEQDSSQQKRGPSEHEAESAADRGKDDVGDISNF